MAVWIGIYLSQLPFEAVIRHWHKSIAAVVLEKECAIAISDQALSLGVRLGMRRSGILALSTEVQFFERQIDKEERARQEAALTLLRFTPELTVIDDTVLVNVTASLRLFGGILRLSRLVRSDMRLLGLSSCLSVAPTAYGAWLLSLLKTTRRRRVLKLARLHALLDRLPCLLLPTLHPYENWLTGIGCETFSDLRRLPRAGLKRRSSAQVLDQLDQAYGQMPELFNWLPTPETFDVHIELAEHVELAEAVFHDARRLVLQLVGWLRARQLAVSLLHFYLDHERGRQAQPPTQFEIACAEPTFDADHLSRLLQERLSRLQLAAHAIGIRLQAVRLEAVAVVSDQLFAEPGGSPGDYRKLIELLAARLGENTVLTPLPLADHRPEINNRWLPILSKRPRVEFVVPAVERPFWLLETPVLLMLRGDQPFYGSPLQMMSSAERIECGWWDERPAIRDYFIAQGQDAARYWVYRQPSEGGVQWFLHGLFA